MSCKFVTVFEYDKLYQSSIPLEVRDKLFSWLVRELAPSVSEDEGATWLKVGYDRDEEFVRFKNYVGVVATPFGVHIEILPKILKERKKADTQGDNVNEGRKLLLDMLLCLHDKAFHHVDVGKAHLLTPSMPLLEVFIGEFLHTTLSLVKRGLRSAYTLCEDNLPLLRGKLLFSEHIRRNICTKDKFYTQFDEFSPNRPENRLLHAALLKCRKWNLTSHYASLLRQLCDCFDSIPVSTDFALDFQRVHLERDMQNYAVPLDWARLILEDKSPVVSYGDTNLPAFLYRMDTLFETFVARKIADALASDYTLTVHASEFHLARYPKNNPDISNDNEYKKLFLLMPDMLVSNKKGKKVLIIDAKWKTASSVAKACKISQQDVYQMFAYGQTYLKGQGEIILVYPQSEDFYAPSPAFEYANAGTTEGYGNLKLWAVPFVMRPCGDTGPSDYRLDLAGMAESENKPNFLNMFPGWD